MADWRSLAQKLALADERIESQDARIIRDEILAAGTLDQSSFEFLIALRRGATSVAVEFDETVFGVVKQVVVKNGAISPEKATWLKGFFGSKNALSKHERAFLQDLRSSGAAHSREFLTWCDKLGVRSSGVATEPEAAPYATEVPMVIAVDEVEPIEYAQIDPQAKPARRRSRLSSRGRAMEARGETSRLGFISLAIALFVYVGTFLLVMIPAIWHPNPGRETPLTIAIGFAIIASLPVTLVGLLIGLKGAFRPSHVNRLCAILGIIFNGLVVLGCTLGLGAMIFFGVGAK